MTRRPRLLLVTLALSLPLLVACENSATAYSVDGNRHALILVREQPYFWTAEVNQYIVASRLPDCQRKVRIHPDSKTLTEIDVYVAGERLWALRQGARWYLASTELCRVQDWDKPDDTPLGALIGRFRLRAGQPVFEHAP